MRPMGAAAERRERLEAALAGLGELEYLRQRQEILVRSALQEHSCEHKLLEENILLLKKQLNCLRRRDAGLISQLQELDRQISDLRLDNEKPSDQMETDSRPSSGFYELSDGASGSLSNSSNSVFSECLSSCHSSTCFCSPLESSLGVSEGRPKCADDMIECVECQCEEQTTGMAGQSLSVSYSPSSDGSTENQSRYCSDLIAKNGGDVYRYPSPLHAVAVQSSIFLQSFVGHIKEETIQLKSVEPSHDFLKPDSTTVSQSTSWTTTCAPSNKKLDNYIFGLLQRRSQPMRTTKPRTSLNADPSKSILRQASLCVRQNSGQSQGKTSEPKGVWQGLLHASADSGSGSPLKQWGADAKTELLENAKVHLLSQNELVNNNSDIQNNILSKMKACVPSKGLTSNGSLKSYPELGSPHALSSPKEFQCCVGIEDNGGQHPPKACTPKKHPKSPTIFAIEIELPALEQVSLGSSSQSQDEGGQIVNGPYLPAQQQASKMRKVGKNLKVQKVKNVSLKSRSVHEHVPEVGCGERPRSRGKIRCHLPDEVTSMHRSSKRTSSTRVRRIPASIPEGRVLDKHSTSVSKTGSSRHHSHGRETVVAKPKYKRSDYRHLKSITEVQYDEALKRARRRHRRDLGPTYLPSNATYSSPYAYVGSDSEYSAECASLFHSTILDTSEDERSNYTTNCFGDSESSFSEGEFVNGSTTSSDSEESGGMNWPQFGQGAQEVRSSKGKAFVKIKASHNLKKKILRFRSGSLKLMTTV